MNKQELLKKIQEYKFSTYDMLLFLDTHPDDEKAFSIYKDLVLCLKKFIKEYEKEYGPLSILSAADFDKFEWTNSPWPWEKEGN